MADVGSLSLKVETEGLEQALADMERMAAAAERFREAIGPVIPCFIALHQEFAHIAAAWGEIAAQHNGAFMEHQSRADAED